jgi:hypothetical protein
MTTSRFVARAEERDVNDLGFDVNWEVWNRALRDQIGGESGIRAFAVSAFCGFSPLVGNSFRLRDLGIQPFIRCLPSFASH